MNLIVYNNALKITNCKLFNCVAQLLYVFVHYPQAMGLYLGDIIPIVSKQKIIDELNAIMGTNL